MLDCFVAAGSELQRTQVAPGADAFTFSEIAGHEGVTPAVENLLDADAEDVLASLRAATNTMDEAEVTTESRTPFIMPTLKARSIPFEETELESRSLVQNTLPTDSNNSNSVLL